MLICTHWLLVKSDSAKSMQQIGALKNLVMQAGRQPFYILLACILDSKPVPGQATLLR